MNISLARKMEHDNFYITKKKKSNSTGKNEFANHIE